MTAPDNIRELVEKFRKDIFYYRSLSYSEAQVRDEFINPFFRALGWDIADSHQVIHGAQLSVEERRRARPKRPDYGFLVDGQAHFYVEIKAPHVSLRDNPDAAYKVRRYGWSARLPASVLTDFEEFSVYDCRIRPSRDDRANENLLRYYTYEQYVEKWDEIAALFSYQAAQDNRLDEWARGEEAQSAETVDNAFLAEMEGWRAMLAKDIAQHNPELSGQDLHRAARLIVDRIVFLRICEDRDLEPYGRLGDLRGVRGIYDTLKQFFQQADAKYSSGLFHSAGETGRGEPDATPLNLQIDDAPLDAILTNLYYPISPYEFSVISADALTRMIEFPIPDNIDPGQ